MDRKPDAALHAYMQELVNNQRPVWESFFDSGGSFMYPTTVFGFLLVLTACLYAIRLQRRLIPIVVATGSLTVASGFMGTFVGLVTVFGYVQFVEPALAAKVAIVGAAQAITNAVFGLLLAIAGGLATLVGLAREAWGGHA